MPPVQPVGVAPTTTRPRGKPMNRRVKVGLVLLIAGVVLGLAFAGLGAVDGSARSHDGQAVLEPGHALVMSFQQNPQFLIVDRAVFQVTVSSGAAIDFYVLNDEGYAAYSAGQPFPPSSAFVTVEDVWEVDEWRILPAGHWQAVIDNTNYGLGRPGGFAATVRYAVTAGGIGSAFLIGGLSASALMAVSGGAIAAVYRRRETSSAGPPLGEQGKGP